METMMRLRPAMAFGLAVFLVPIHASGADLINMDRVPYEVVVFNPITEEEKLVEVLGGETIFGICDFCELSFEDSETIVMEGDDAAVIKEGQLTVSTRT